MPKGRGPRGRFLLNHPISAGRLLSLVNQREWWDITLPSLPLALLARTVPFLINLVSRSRTLPFLINAVSGLIGQDTSLP